MATVSFPLVIWPITEDRFVGQVIGTDYSVMDISEGELVRSAGEYVSKSFRINGVIDPPEIENPVLKIYNVPMQLVYRESTGVYPLPQKSLFQVAAVHSKMKSTGFGQCFLPLYDKSFFYHSQEQLKVLIEYVVRNTVENMEPEQALQYRMPIDPVMAQIRVKVDENDRTAVFIDQIDAGILNEVCDRMPLSGPERKALSRLPEIAWEREDAAFKLANFLIEGNANIVLVGEQGVGKTLLLNDALKIAARESKKQKITLTLWRTTSQRLISKAKYLGEWQEICDEVVETLRQVNGVLWITDLANLINIGGESQEDSVAAYLQPFIVKGTLRVIGEMRPREMDFVVARLPDFIKCFEQNRILELNRGASLSVLKRFANYAQSNFNVLIDDDALDLVLLLVDRYVTYECSPGRHVNFLGECIKHAVENSQRINRDDVIHVFVEYTGLPEIILRDEIPLDDKILMDFFSARIIGQENVLKKICRVVQTFKAGLNDPDKPIATLLFAGQTGVGKTAAVKAISSYFFEAGQKYDPLFRLDMSEFQYPEHIEKLIGGNGSSGKLIQHVRNNPFSVILLDEIEKAHESVFDALLTVFDEGMLTDRFGRTTDFRSTIIVMTSNLGTGSTRRPGFSDSGNYDSSIGEIRNFFRPEFFNRIDDVLLFQALSKKSILVISRIEINNIQKRDRIVERNIKLHFSDAVVEFIAEVGFSPVYGARPIQRAVEKHVVHTLSQAMLESANTKELFIDVVDGQVRASVSPVRN